MLFKQKDAKERLLKLKKKDFFMPNQLGGYTFGELELGQVFDFSKIISKEDVKKFAEASGDNNPIHLDEAYAATTQFKNCIVHGVLTAGLVSAAIGMNMPGPGSIYVGQNLQFRRPVKVGAKVDVHLEIKELNPDKKFVTIATTASVDGKTVLTGEALVMVPAE